MRKYAQYIFLFGIILSSELYFFWGLEVGKYGQLICAISALILSGMKVEEKSFTSCLLFFLFYLYASLYVLDLNLLGRLFSFLPFFVFFLKKRDVQKIYTLYQDFFVYTITISLAVYFLVIWMQFDLPYSVIEPLNKVKTYNYLAYPFCVIPDESYFSHFRFCGCYDEPGVVGTIAGVMLVTNRWDMRNWKNIVLLISGIFSFSLYFYLLQFLYFLFYARLRYKIVASFLLIGLFFYLQNDELVNEFLLARLDFSGGDFSGDNRTTALFDSWYRDFLFTTDFWIGCGKGMANIVDLGGASYKHLIVDYGFIMFAIYMFSFLYLIWRNHSVSKKFLIISIVFFSLIYQRPFIFIYLYLFLLVSPIYVLKE
ncbi:hypothetical protein [Parabacteroides sp. ZJ-118]|uniref:hypothetical protein n=1 Tax=Parabacteroides sp. ZJ-118 TaxID=2709398 RepID=UPI0013EBFF05|nr:hypothetical protein [Parabacteroides sp. ZJ-118]